MLITIVGESGSGKSAVKDELETLHNTKSIVTYTTRDKRPGETQDIDYHFISNDEFLNMIESNQFLEYESYSGNRLYGTSRQSIREAIDSTDIYVAVVTPGGMRAIKKEFDKMKMEGLHIGEKRNNCLFSVHITAPLGTRVKRYINRLGDKFDHDDMAEISQRVERDYGMFLNIERETDFEIDNPDSMSIKAIAETIYHAAKVFNKDKNTYNIIKEVGLINECCKAINSKEEKEEKEADDSSLGR